MTTLAYNPHMASACLNRRMIPVDITVLVVSVCAVLLRVILWSV